MAASCASDSSATSAPSRRPTARALLITAFALVELDRLVASLARLTAAPLGQPLSHPGGPPWTTSFDIAGVLIAIASLAFARAYFLASPISPLLGTITLTAASLYTLLFLGALLFGGGLAADPVVAATYVATSLPIALLAYLHLREQLLAFSPSPTPPLL